MTHKKVVGTQKKKLLANKGERKKSSKGFNKQTDFNYAVLSSFNSIAVSTEISFLLNKFPLNLFNNFNKSYSIHSFSFEGKSAQIHFYKLDSESSLFLSTDYLPHYSSLKKNLFFDEDFDLLDTTESKFKSQLSEFISKNIFSKSNKLFKYTNYVFHNLPPNLKKYLYSKQEKKNYHLIDILYSIRSQITT